MLQPLLSSSRAAARAGGSSTSSSRSTICSSSTTTSSSSRMLLGRSSWTPQHQQHQQQKRPSVAARAQEDPDPKDLESMFSQELKRRGLDSVDDLNSDEGAQGSSSSSTSSKSPFQSSATQTTPRTRQAAGAGELEGQRQRSIAMVNEGLEGLIPRATELLKLGGSVFLAFAPFILAISLLFGGIYLMFGDNFVHGGDRASGPPPYVDPSELLSEPTVDPYIPYQ